MLIFCISAAEIAVGMTRHQQELNNTEENKKKKFSASERFPCETLGIQ